MARLVPTQKPNPIWRRHARSDTITLPSRPLFQPDDTFFLMGSCFAEEIRLAIQAAMPQATVGPDYASLAFDPKCASVDELPGRNHLNFYNTFSVLQEIQRCCGLWEQTPDDFWRVGDRVQDPFRRLVFADTPERLHQIAIDLTAVMTQAFRAADHFVFTFGMTEVFFDHRSGRAACQKPNYGKGGGKEETEFRATGFQENLDNVLAISDLIAAHRPDARIFVTVSPVPLSMTFGTDDIFVANSLSKSTLRAVLGEAVKARDNMTYVPSYEAVISGGTSHFLPDRRHVARPVVEAITAAFIKAYSAGA